MTTSSPVTRMPDALLVSPAELAANIVSRFLTWLIAMTRRLNFRPVRTYALLEVLGRRR